GYDRVGGAAMSDMPRPSSSERPRDRTRREVLRVAALASVAPLSLSPAVVATGTHEGPLEIGAGPQLFLDDYLVEQLDGFERRTESPEKLDRPVLDSKTFGCTQPYATVLRDEDTGRYRIWYNYGPAVWYATSPDGLHWEAPRVAWDLPRSYGASLLDDG